MHKWVALFLVLAWPAASDSAQPAHDTGTVLCDSALRIDRGQGHLFVATKINGKRTPDATLASGRDTTVPGARLEIVGARRTLAAGPSTVSLYATTHHAMPISALLHPSRRVSGVVDFVPVDGEVYRVAGVLGEAYSAVWIEDAHGEIVSARVETGDRPAHAEAGGKQVEADDSERLPDDRTRTFLGLKEGECSDLVEERLGAPDEIEDIRGLFHPPYAIHRYAALGTLHFRKTRTGRFVSRVVPLETTESVSADRVRQAIETSQPETLRQIASSYYRANIRDMDVLDLLANEAWRRRDTRDRSTADAIAWFCKTLGQSGNPRYRDVLAAIARDGHATALKRHARRSLELLPQEQAVQFRPDET